MNQPPPPFPPPPPAPLGPPGKARLYLPHRLFAGHQESFQAGDSPVANVGQVPLLPIFPLPPPPGLIAQNPVLHMHPLQIAEYTTSPNSQTKTASQISQLQQSNDGLQRVRVYTSLWENLVRYAGHPNTQQGGPPPLANTTWTIPSTRRIPLPLAQQQIDGVKALAAWYLYHINRVSVAPKMNSEPSVQGEVLLQAIEPTNCLLKIRYPPLGAHNNNATYPRWGRSCDALHKTPGLPNNAGYPDFLLICSAATHHHGAIMEAKPWWAYTNEDFYDLFRGVSTVTRDGVFEGDSNTVMGKLMRQLWGQLHNFECSLGFCTNGRLIMFFAKSGPNTLVLSQLREWHHPGVHAALAGLSYAGVDIRHIGQTVMVDQRVHKQIGWCIGEGGSPKLSF